MPLRKKSKFRNTFIHVGVHDPNWTRMMVYKYLSDMLCVAGNLFPSKFWTRYNDYAEEYNTSIKR